LALEGGPSRTVSPGVTVSSPVGRPTNPAACGDASPARRCLGDNWGQPDRWPHEQTFGSAPNPRRPLSLGAATIDEVYGAKSVAVWSLTSIGCPDRLGKGPEPSGAGRSS